MPSPEFIGTASIVLYLFFFIAMPLFAFVWNHKRAIDLNVLLSIIILTGPGFVALSLVASALEKD